jgi:membrane protein required for colicin V production
MNAFDWTLIIVVAVSALFGLVRGFVRELVALAGWIAGILLAVRYSTAVGTVLPFVAKWPALATSLAALLIVAGCVFAAALIGWAIHRLLTLAKLSASDRVLGAFFGVLRGVLIAFAAVFFLGRTPLAQQDWWRGAIMLPYIEAAVRFATPFLPMALAGEPAGSVKTK